MVSGSCRFISGTLQVSTSTICGYANYGIWQDSTYGSVTLVNRGLITSIVPDLRIERWTANSMITQSPTVLSDSSWNSYSSFYGGLLLSRNQKILIGHFGYSYCVNGDYDYSYYCTGSNAATYLHETPAKLYTPQLDNGTANLFKSDFVPKASWSKGFYGNRALFQDGTKLYLTPAYFAP